MTPATTPGSSFQDLPCGGADPVAVFLLKPGEENGAFAAFEPVRGQRHCRARMKARNGEPVLLEPDGPSCLATPAIVGLGPLPGACLAEASGGCCGRPELPTRVAQTSRISHETDSVGETAGVDNVEFLKGEIESIPLPDCAFDVVISNCVINLSVDKSRVLKETFRALRPGDRLAVSDVVPCGDVPSKLRNYPELWAGCVAGAMPEAKYKSELAAAGFVDIGIAPTTILRAVDTREFLSAAGAEAAAVADQADGTIMSTFVRAHPPQTALVSRKEKLC